MVGGQMVQHCYCPVPTTPPLVLPMLTPQVLNFVPLSPTQGKLVFCHPGHPWYANCCMIAQNYPYKNNPNIATRVKLKGQVFDSNFNDVSDMKVKASGPTIMSQNDELVLLNVQAVTGSGLQDWSQSGIAGVHWGKTRLLATLIASGQNCLSYTFCTSFTRTSSGIPNPQTAPDINPADP